MYLEGVVSVNVTANTNDWDPDVSVSDWIRVTSSGTWDITGLTAKYRGRLLSVSVLSGTIVIKNASGSSSVGNRFICSADITVSSGQTVMLAYDLASTAWRVLAEPSALANDSVTFAKMQNIATDTLIGRDTAGTGDPESISVGGGIEFTGAGALRIAAFTGDVTKTAGGTKLTIGNNVVSNAKAAQMPALTVKGNDTGSTANAKDLTMSELRAILGFFVPVPKTSDQNVTNSTTLVDATDLSVAVSANTKYIFKIRLFFKTSGTSANAKYSITGPSSPTVFEAHVYDFGEGATEAERHFGANAYFTENITIGSGGLTTGTGYAEIMLIFHNGANSGNLKIQFANQTAAGQTTTLRAGSIIEYKQI